MFQTIINAFKIKEVRRKILITIALLFVYRLGCHIPVPGVNVFDGLEDYTFLQIMSAVSGGALTYGTFFAPGEYYKRSFAMSENLTMISEADDVYRGLDVAKKYSDSMFKIAQLSSDEEEQRALIETEIKTAMKEHMAIFIKEGVTDTNWKTFIDVLKNIGCDKYVAMYQAAIDKLHID